MSGKGHRPTLSYTPKERRDYGVIATLVDTETGETRVEHVGAPHTTMEATREVCAICDRLGPSWKVQTLSHPLSIQADLRNESRERPPLTETMILGKLGRNDLIAFRAKFAGLRTREAMRRRRRVD